MAKPKKCKSLCGGCYNDEYNQGLGGAKECFSYKTMKVTKQHKIHIDQVPPFKDMKPEWYPSCYNQQRFVMVPPDGITKEGYWKK